MHETKVQYWAVCNVKIHMFPNVRAVKNKHSETDGYAKGFNCFLYCYN